MLQRLDTDALTPETLALLDEEAISGARDALAAELAACGAAAGDRVAIVCGTRPEMVAARDAAALAGLAVVPLHPALPAPELAHVLDHARPRAVLVEPGRGGDVAGAARLTAHRPAVLELPAVPARPLRGPRAQSSLATAWGPLRGPRRQTSRAAAWGKLRGSVRGAADRRSAAPALPVGATLIYTSGTTGRPKGCVRTAEQEAARADELVATYGLGPHDVHLIACPLAYSAPGILLRAARRAGADTALLPRFSPTSFLAAAQACRATVFFLVPTQYERLLELPPEQRGRFDLSSLRAALVAGAPMPARLRRRVIEWLGPGRLWEFYGSSETGTISVLGPDEQLVHPETVGRPVAGVELRLDRPPDQPDAPGEIFVRSPTVMSGYWNPATQAAEWPGTADGFVSVGDLGIQARAGDPLRLVDRIHDTIISGGVNVYPAEVERALHEHPAVAAAVVFGVADPRWHERVAALVVRAAGSAVGEEELRSYLRGQLAPHKVPKQIVFVAADELPRSTSGKPLRRAAAALLR
jgi:acyl-CoA synthetase (AMP-forming)/AMP-acid ligase II